MPIIDSHIQAGELDPRSVPIHPLGLAPFAVAVPLQLELMPAIVRREASVRGLPDPLREDLSCSRKQADAVLRPFHSGFGGVLAKDRPRGILIAGNFLNGGRLGCATGVRIARVEEEEIMNAVAGIQPPVGRESAAILTPLVNVLGAGTAKQPPGFAEGRLRWPPDGVDGRVPRAGAGTSACVAPVRSAPGAAIYIPQFAGDDCGGAEVH